MMVKNQVTWDFIFCSLFLHLSLVIQILQFNLPCIDSVNAVNGLSTACCKSYIRKYYPEMTEDQIPNSIAEWRALIWWAIGCMVEAWKVAPLYIEVLLSQFHGCCKSDALFILQFCTNISCSIWAFYVPLFGTLINLGLFYWKHHSHPLNFVLLTTFTAMKAFTIGNCLPWNRVFLTLGRCSHCFLWHESGPPGLVSIYISYYAYFWLLAF